MKIGLSFPRVYYLYSIEGAWVLGHRATPLDLRITPHPAVQQMTALGLDTDATPVHLNLEQEICEGDALVAE